MVAIPSRGKTIFSFTHIEDMTLSACEEFDEVAKGESEMGVNMIDEVARAR